MGERRGSRRSKSFLRGFVYVSRKRGALACLVRDLSEKGARIIFSDTVTLPDVVELYIPQREQTLRARVQWRRNDEIGLAFTATERAADDCAKRHGSRSAPRHAGSRNRLAARAAQAAQGRKGRQRRRSGGLTQRLNLFRPRFRHAAGLIICP